MTYEELRNVNHLYCTSCGTPLILNDRYVPPAFLRPGRLWDDVYWARSPQAQNAAVRNQDFAAAAALQYNSTAQGKNTF